MRRAWNSSRAEKSILHYRPRTVTHTYAGLELSVRISDPLGEDWYDHDFSEAVYPEIEFLRARDLLAGSNVFDIGAHQGIVALMLARLVGADGSVVALEPNPHNAGVAAQNILLNRAGNLSLLPLAVGERLGEVLFERGGSAVTGLPKSAERVACVTVDDLSATYGRPDLLWIDVEGFECQVLRGARATLQHRPAVCVEVHGGRLLEAQGGSVREVFDHLGDEYEFFVNLAPNDGVHGMEPLRDRAPVGRFSILALP